MFTYEFCHAKSIEDVCRFRKEYGSKGCIVAGGTDVMVQIKEKSRRWAEIECMMDLTSLDKELRYIREEGDCVKVGALSTHTDIAESEIIKKYAPFFGQASDSVGSPQIRNRGTIGGSICNASPAADPLTPLVALEANVEIAGLNGTREVPLVDLYVGRGKLGLGEDEFVTAFIFKKPEEGSLMYFQKLGRRKALAISRLNTSALLHLDAEGKIDKARIAPGCIFATPMRVVEAEEILLGKVPSEELFEEAGREVSRIMIEKTGYRWSTEYKQPAAEAVVSAALCNACGIEMA